MKAYQKLADITSDPEFVRDKIGIFFVRDPRDILVSSYFSFGYSHGLSPVDELRDLQQGARSEIQAVSLDEYVLASAKEIGRNFEILWDLKNACQRSVLLKYEEMIENFDLFLSQFTKFVSVDPSVAREIHERSRPSQKEDASSHRRSGQVGGFRGKLKPETLDILAKELGPILSKFNY